MTAILRQINRKRNIFSISATGTTSYMYEKVINHYLTPHIKVHLKWITNPNLKRKTMKLLESKVEELFKLNVGKTHKILKIESLKEND